METCPTFLVECFWPGITESSHAQAVTRAGAAADALRAGGCDVRLVDSFLVLADEVVFCRFAAKSLDDARRAAELAGLPFERVLACVEARGGGPR